jgi:hypothetical protein
MRTAAAAALGAPVGAPRRAARAAAAAPGGVRGAARGARQQLRSALLRRPGSGALPQRSALLVRAAASSPGSSPSGNDPALTVAFDNESDTKSTVVSIVASNRPGVLHCLTQTFKDLDLAVNKAEVDMRGELLAGAACASA